MTETQTDSVYRLVQYLQSCAKTVARIVVCNIFISVPQNRNHQGNTLCSLDFEWLDSLCCALLEPSTSLLTPLEWTLWPISCFWGRGQGPLNSAIVEISTITYAQRQQRLLLFITIHELKIPPDTLLIKTVLFYVPQDRHRCRYNRSNLTIKMVIFLPSPVFIHIVNPMFKAHFVRYFTFDQIL